MLDLAEKVCSKCGCTKLLDDFYRNANARDGLYAECKACFNERQRIYREANRDRLRAVSRTQRARDYRRTYRRQHPEVERKWREKNPVKARAHKILNEAVRIGEIIRPDTCSECPMPGPLHGHHDDYTKPFEVRWLCPLCHVAWHRENEAITGAYTSLE